MAIARLVVLINGSGASVTNSVLHFAVEARHVIDTLDVVQRGVEMRHTEAASKVLVVLVLVLICLHRFWFKHIYSNYVHEHINIKYITLVCDGIQKEAIRHIRICLPGHIYKLYHSLCGVHTEHDLLRVPRLTNRS